MLYLHVPLVTVYLLCMFQLREYRRLKDQSNKQVSAKREQLDKLRRVEQSDEAAARHHRSLKQGLDEQRKNLIDKAQELENRVERLNEYLRCLVVLPLS